MEELTCYVYLIQRRHGAVKIGVAKDPVRRLKDLQVGNSAALHLIAKIPCATSVDAFALEKDMHKKFWRFKQGQGEWFRKSVIRAMRDGGDLPSDGVLLGLDVPGRAADLARKKYAGLNVDNLYMVIGRLERRCEKLEQAIANSANREFLRTGEKPKSRIERRLMSERRTTSGSNGAAQTRNHWLAERERVGVERDSERHET